MIITFENGYGLLEGDKLSIRINSTSKLEHDFAPAKTYYPKKQIYDKNPFVNNKGINAIYESLSRTETTDGFKNAHSTMKSIFLALISNEANSTPINAQDFIIDSEFAARDWMIS
jgi:hypothetical protein